MISAQFLWGNMFLRGDLQRDVKNSDFKNFESALNLESVRMPLRNKLALAVEVFSLPKLFGTAARIREVKPRV